MSSEYPVIRGGEAGLGALLPPGIVAVEAVGDVAPDELLEGEPAIIARAVEARQLEFARGRSCARRAARGARCREPAPILSDDRAPIWPAKVIGSITHCREYCCAAVANSDRWLALGIDVELLRPLEPGVRDQIMIDTELPQLDGLDPEIPWPCVVFSAKEALYKAWYPIAKRWLDFHEVAVRLDVTRGRFEAEMLVDALPSTWRCALVEGRFSLDRDRVRATVVLRHS